MIMMRPSVVGAAFLLLLATVAQGSNEFGLKFLEENGKKEGVVTLASGLQYKVLREGDGDEHPQAGTSCSCHYEGRTAQEFPGGKTFDSSYERGDPTSFAPNQVIKGWTEAMQLMVQGDKWEMYIPSELGYGESGSGENIKGGDVLVFTMEILSIDGPTTPADRGPPPFVEVTTTAAFDEWDATPAAPKIIGVFRKLKADASFSGKLFRAFKGAAKKIKKKGGEATVMTHSSVDSKTGKWVPTAMVEELAAKDGLPTFKGNNIYVQKKAGSKWKRCKTNAKDTAVSGDEVRQAILDCATKKKKKGQKKAAAAPKEEL